MPLKPMAQPFQTFGVRLFSSMVTAEGRVQRLQDAEVQRRAVTVIFEQDCDVPSTKLSTITHPHLYQDGGHHTDDILLHFCIGNIWMWTELPRSIIQWDINDDKPAYVKIMT